MDTRGLPLRLGCVSSSWGSSTGALAAFLRRGDCEIPACDAAVSCTGSFSVFFARDPLAFGSTVAGPGDMRDLFLGGAALSSASSCCSCTPLEPESQYGLSSIERLSLLLRRTSDAASGSGSASASAMLASLFRGRPRFLGLVSSSTSPSSLSCRAISLSSFGLLFRVARSDASPSATGTAGGRPRLRF